MKKIIYFLTVVFFSISISCSDYLEEKAKSQLTETYFNTPQGLSEGVYGAYSQLRQIYKEGMFRFNIYSDIWDNGASMDNSDSRINAVDNGDVESIFNGLHKGIMVSNRMIQVIGNDTITNPTNKDYLAELRTLRAFYYFINVEMWGSRAHYQEKVYDAYDTTMTTINQKSVEFFYSKILADINYGIANLKVPSAVKEFGRVNKGMAKALKARMLMALAGYAHSDYTGQPEFEVFKKLGYSNVNAVYAEANTLANSVIADYGYSLQVDWESIFDDKNQANKEIIWSVQWCKNTQFNQQGIDAQWVHRYAVGRNAVTIKQTLNATSGKITYGELSAKRTAAQGGAYTFPSHSRYYGREYRHMAPTYFWIKSFNVKDKRLYGTFESVYYKLASPADLSDPALPLDTVVYMPFREITLAEDAKGITEGKYVDGLNEIYDLDNPEKPAEYGGLRTVGRSKYHSFKKYYDRSRTDMGKQEYGFENVTVLRLAEMYLIKAECDWKLGLGETTVYADLQPLWNRSFTSAADREVYKTGVNLDFILDEYARELGGECERWFLLKRTRSLVSRIMKWVPKSAEESAKFRARDLTKQTHYLKAIPYNQAIRFSNWNADKQSPGY